MVRDCGTLRHPTGHNNSLSTDRAGPSLASAATLCQPLSACRHGRSGEPARCYAVAWVGRGPGLTGT